MEKRLVYHHNLIGHECAWEDVTEYEHVVRHEDRYKEYERADRLIKLDILEKREKYDCKSEKNGI